MSWLYRAACTVIGGGAGGPFGAGLGYVVGSMLDEEIGTLRESEADPTPRIPRNPRKPRRLRARWSATLDEFGEHREVRFAEAFPKGTMARFVIDQPVFSSARSFPPFSTGCGQFQWFSDVLGDRCECFIPHAAVRAKRLWPSALRVHVILPGAGAGAHRVIGSASFPLRLPRSAPRWEPLRYWSPAIRLMVSVGASGGALSPRAAGVIRDFCISTLSMGSVPPDPLWGAFNKAQLVMAEDAGTAVEREAAAFRRRAPVLVVERLAAACVRVACADGPPTASARQAVRRVLHALGVSEPVWSTPAPSERAEPTPDEYAELGLSPGASPADIRSAYRRLMQRYHPDKWHNASPRERAEAHRRTASVRKAYESLRARRVSS